MNPVMSKLWLFLHTGFSITVLVVLTLTALTNTSITVSLLYILISVFAWSCTYLIFKDRLKDHDAFEDVWCVHTIAIERYPYVTMFIYGILAFGTVFNFVFYLAYGILNPDTVYITKMIYLLGWGTLSLALWYMNYDYLVECQNEDVSSTIV